MVDAKYVLSAEQVITANTTTVDSTNVVDLGDIENDRYTDVTAGERGPINEDIRLIVRTGAVAHTVAGNLTTTLYDSADNSTFAVLVPTVSVVRAQATYLAAGQANADGLGVLILDVVLPRFMQRYLKITYETSANWSANLGTVNAYLHFGNRYNRALAS